MRPMQKGLGAESQANTKRSAGEDQAMTSGAMTKAADSGRDSEMSRK